jgi:hypothetical protein
MLYSHLTGRVVPELPPYTAAEKEWLEARFGHEFRFLHRLNLSIYEREDREEGRRILRAFIAAEPQASYRRAWNPNPTYTDAEEAWLKKYWGGEFGFLDYFDLSFHIEKHRECGRHMVRAMIARNPELIEGFMEESANDSGNDTGGTPGGNEGQRR